MLGIVTASLSHAVTIPSIIFYLHQNVIRNHVFIPIVYTDNDFRQFSLSC